MKDFNVILMLLFSCFFPEISNAQDWANLNRFKNENMTLIDSESQQDRVVFMGNSITEGWLTFRPTFFKDNPYVNRGIGGQTTPQMLVRFRPDVVDLKPAVVVILAGINDIAGNTGQSTLEMISNNIFSMCEIARANNIRVVLCSILPASSFPWRPEIKPSDKVVELNTLLESYAKAHGILYADYFSAMVNDTNGLKEALGYDPVHPNEAGYIIMEPIIQKVIRKALKLK